MGAEADHPTPQQPDQASPGLAPEVEERVVAPSAESFRRLVRVMAQLRSPQGCPWDLEQTHSSLARHLLEETYEVLEAIDAGDPDGLREELGDLVLQVVFHAQLAFDEGGFTISDVLDELRAKLVRRHPHVFGEAVADDAEVVLANWERMKRDETGKGVLEGIPKAMPALSRAAKVTRRTAQVGFDWPDAAAAAGKVDEELSELRTELAGPAPDQTRIEEEVGDLLFAVAALARKAGVEPETALRRSVEGFIARFAGLEQLVRSEGHELESLSPDAWGEYWERTKAGGSG